MPVQDRHMSPRSRRVTSVMRPGVQRGCLRMAAQVKNLHDTLPYRLPLERLFNWHAGHVRGIHAMQPLNHVAQIVNVVHAVVASTNSPTLQNDFSTPAAIAGVQRSVEWRSTRL